MTSKMLKINYLVFYQDNWLKPLEKIFFSEKIYTIAKANLETKIVRNKHPTLKLQG